MTDVLCAPFPFLIGTHVDNLKGLEHLPTEQVSQPSVAPPSTDRQHRLHSPLRPSGQRRPLTPMQLRIAHPLS